MAKTAKKTSKALIEKMALGILEEIREMQAVGYGNKGDLLPPVSSFGELHDYIDANVGWFSMSDDEPLDVYNAVFDRVDDMLRDAFHADMMRYGWEPADDGSFITIRPNVEARVWLHEWVENIGPTGSIPWTRHLWKYEVTLDGEKIAGDGFHYFTRAVFGAQHVIWKHEHGLV